MCSEVFRRVVCSRQQVLHVAVCLVTIHVCVDTMDDGAGLWPGERGFLGGRLNKFRDVFILHKYDNRKEEVILALGRRNTDGLTNWTDCLKAAVPKLKDVVSGSDIEANHPL